MENIQTYIKFKSQQAKFLNYLNALDTLVDAPTSVLIEHLLREHKAMIEAQLESEIMSCDEQTKKNINTFISENEYICAPDEMSMLFNDFMKIREELVM